MDTNLLNWKKLESHAKLTPDLTFSILKARSGHPERLQFSLSRALAEKVGFTSASTVELMVSESSGPLLYKLQVVANDGSSNRLTQKSMNRYHWTIPNTGGVGERWDFLPCSQQPLKISACANGCIVFYEPEYVKEGEGEE